MKIRELRQNLAKVLDRVDAGEVIEIERGDAVYYLSKEKVVNTGVQPAETNKVYEKLLDIEDFLREALEPVEIDVPLKKIETKPAGMVKIDTRGKQYSKNIKENPDGTISPALTEELPCCQRQCPHWIWDGLNGQWKNKISGRVRDVS